MKTEYVTKILIVLLISQFLTLNSYATEIEAGVSAKFYEACEADFDNNGFNDVAILFEYSLGTELIVILKNKAGNKYFQLYKGKESKLQLTCKYRKAVNAIFSDIGDRVTKSHAINSFVVELIQPESSHSVFYWNENEFSRIWLSD